MNYETQTKKQGKNMRLFKITVPTFEQFKLFSTAKGYKTVVMPNGRQAFKISVAGKYFGRHYALNAEEALKSAYNTFKEEIEQGRSEVWS